MLVIVFSFNFLGNVLQYESKWDRFFYRLRVPMENFYSLIPYIEREITIHIPNRFFWLIVIVLSVPIKTWLKDRDCLWVFSLYNRFSYTGLGLIKWVEFLLTIFIKFLDHFKASFKRWKTSLKICTSFSAFLVLWYISY